MTSEQILKIARSEIGTKEYPANSNNVKYNTEYYGKNINGSNYSWCAVFVWWVFKKAGASNLFYGGNKTAYCPTLMNYHKNQWVKSYKPGDIIFFNFDGKKNAVHVGICESVNGSTITTIDGNTGSGNEANGGAVMRRVRNKKYIVGAYRPKYSTAINQSNTAKSDTTKEKTTAKNYKMEDEDMTQEKFNEMMNNYLKSLQDNDCGQWSEAGRKFVTDKGLFVGGETINGKPNYMWGSFLTREQFAVVMKRFAEIIGVS